MDRLALVIGNSDYIYVPKLSNPKNDANDIESVLQKLNFDVIKLLDAKLSDIQNAINNFLQRLDEYQLVYYSMLDMECKLMERTILSLLTVSFVIKERLLYLAIV